MPPKKGPKLNTHQKRELKKQRERLLEAGGAAIEKAQAQQTAGSYDDALDSLDVAEAAFREAVAISPTPQPDPLYNVGVVFMNRAENAEARAAANPAEAFAALITAEEHLASARVELEASLAAESSGRGAVTALAHAALATVLSAQSERARTIVTRIQLQTDAIRHLEATRRIQQGQGGVEPGVGLQSGDALALLMVLLIEAQQSGANGDEDITPQIVARCEQAIGQYDAILTGQIQPDDGVDFDLMVAKAQAYHDFAAWAVESPGIIPVEMLSAVLTDARGLVLGLAEINPVQAATDDKLMVQGGVLSLCAQHADATGATAGVARGFRTEALAAYQAALALPAPPMEAQCSIAELFHDAGKSEAGLGDPDGLAGGLLANAQAAFMSAVQTNPNDTECVYNLACVASLLGDHAQAQATLEAAVTNTTDSAEILAEIREDPDFANVHQDPWFQALVGGGRDAMAM